MSGRFITFEGLDGCGKTTQLQLLAEALRAQGHDVLETRNPGGTPLGRSLREILLHTLEAVAPRAELLLYAADRAQHVEALVRPALAAGKMVLCDRFIDSTVAYQGDGRGLDRGLIDQVNAMATGGLVPDLTFLFDAPVAVLQARLSGRGPADRLEREALDFHERVRDGFINLAAAHPTRFCVLPADDPVDVLHQAVLQRLAVG